MGAGMALMPFAVALDMAACEAGGGIDDEAGVVVVMQEEEGEGEYEVHWWCETWWC